MMFIPGSTYWNLCMDKAKGEMEKDYEGIKTMHNLGRNMAWLIKAVNHLVNRGTSNTF
jgi:hypothetical protein